MEIDKQTGHILTLIVPNKDKKIFSKQNGVKIPWENVSKIGDDIIFVKNVIKD